jgi:dolichol-phosphate mannosyltransferase
MNSLSIVLPTLNELENLRVLYPEIRASFPQAHVIIVDDASSDGTKAYLDSLVQQDKNLHVLFRAGKLGIGSAHLDGLEMARRIQSEYVLTMDADRTHRVVDIRLLWQARDTASLLVGSRYLRGSQIVGWSKFRLFLTYAGHIVTSIFFGTAIDMSSGLRLYNIEKIPFDNLLHNCPHDYEFFFSSILVYRKMGMTIFQVPVVLEKRGAGNSKMTLGLMRRGVVRLFIYGLRLRRIILLDKVGS